MTHFLTELVLVGLLLPVALLSALGLVVVGVVVITMIKS